MTRYFVRYVDNRPRYSPRGHETWCIISILDEESSTITDTEFKLLIQEKIYHGNNGDRPTVLHMSKL